MDLHESQSVDSVSMAHTKNGVSLLVKFIIIVFFCLSFLIALYIALVTPPSDAIEPTLVSIPSGTSLKGIGLLLEKHHIIRSQAIFSLFVARFHNEKNIAAGDYLFRVKAPVTEIARRFAVGDHGITTQKITFPEGVTILDMADILAREMPNFDKEAFLTKANGSEGFLFPDTYFFYSTATSGPIVSTMKENFIIKTSEMKSTSEQQKKNWRDVVILASIVEKEAATALDRRIIAGILEKRLSSGMRLQVDAPFMYSMGKASLELSLADLSTTSPYNTYRYEGLPPTAIGNPGADAIAAVIAPQITDYLYYLSDKEGKMYYAETFAEHKLNRAKYLR